MAPIHIVVCVLAMLFQLTNATSIGGWLAGYGPTHASYWAGKTWRLELGLVVWGWGLLGNIYHDDVLREIRRAADRKQRKEAEKSGKPIEKVDKVYMVPESGLFKHVLYAHYFCEWVEWAGFWVAGGWKFHPAQWFLVNEFSTMLPRALQGKKWYIDKFGREAIGDRKAVIPGVI